MPLDPLMLPKIWFLRHGQTEWNVERRLQGRLDSPLTDIGIAQAETQSRLIAPFVRDVATGPGGIYTSPLGRAQQTARVALNGTAFRIDDRLSEIATGEWEGKLRDEVASDRQTAGVHKGMQDLMAYAEAPGGEGFVALRARVSDFLQDLTGPSIIVSHGLLGQVLRGLVCGLSRDEMARLSNLQGCVYVLEQGRETVLSEDERIL